MKILDFPIIRQSTIYTCSCASLAGILCYYGFNKRERQLANLMYVNQDSQEIHPRRIIRAARKFGLKARYAKLTIDDLIGYINKNIPVVVNFQSWSDAKIPDYTTDNNGHYATVIGYCEKKRWLIFSDPASFYRTYLSWDEFELRWHDGNVGDSDYDHRGIIIWGKGTMYNSNKIIHAT